jgi:hypothetical protein
MGYHADNCGENVPHGHSCCICGLVLKLKIKDYMCYNSVSRWKTQYCISTKQFEVGHVGGCNVEDER